MHAPEEFGRPFLAACVFRRYDSRSPKNWIESEMNEEKESQRVV